MIAVNIGPGHEDLELLSLEEGGEVWHEGAIFAPNKKCIHGDLILRLKLGVYYL